MDEVNGETKKKTQVLLAILIFLPRKETCLLCPTAGE